MISLGLDSSITGYGWAVLDSNESTLLAVGTWRTKVDQKAGKMVDRARRVKEIGQQLVRLIQEQQPERAFIESLALGMKTSRSTAQTLGRMRGLTEGICLALGVELFEVRPDIVKHAITGDRGASKDGVALQLRKLFPLAMVRDADENGTDALAVAVAGGSGRSLQTAATSGVVRHREDGGGPFDPLDLDY